MITYKLFFDTPLHLCAASEGYEKTYHYLHSDTLFSAVLANWFHFYSDNQDDLIKNLSFSISSAFPFHKEDYYFPKPFFELSLIFENMDEKIAKKLRKVKFFEKGLFEKVIKNEAVDIRNVHFSQSGDLASLKSSVSDFFIEREISRNLIDRVTGATEIFYFSEIVFKKNSGLFFLADFNDEIIKKKFTAVLRFLGDEGIGSDRHVGKGLFEVEIKNDFTLNQPESSDSILNLSLYCPTPREIENKLLDGSAYDIIKRSGWITAPGYGSLRKKSFNMFLEGSVFSCLKKEDYGNIPIVLEKQKNLIPFNVYRSGKGFMIKCIHGETHDK
jgi:CRISPR-associated protein Csm4